MTIIDNLLLQAIDSNKEKIKEYQLKLLQLNTQTEILYKENIAYLEKYQELCPHELSSRETVGYMEGGYDHVSETHYREVCTRCGKITASNVVRGTYA